MAKTWALNGPIALLIGVETVLHSEGSPHAHQDPPHSRPAWDAKTFAVTSASELNFGVLYQRIRHVTLCLTLHSFSLP